MTHTLDIKAINTCRTQGTKPTRTLFLEIDSEAGRRVLKVSESVASELVAKLRALQPVPSFMSELKRL